MASDHDLPTATGHTLPAPWLHAFLLAPLTRSVVLLGCQGGLLLEQSALKHFPREDPLTCLQGAFLVVITAW